MWRNCICLWHSETQASCTWCDGMRRKKKPCDQYCIHTFEKNLHHWSSFPSATRCLKWHASGQLCVYTICVAHVSLLWNDFNTFHFVPLLKAWRGLLNDQGVIQHRRIWIGQCCEFRNCVQFYRVLNRLCFGLTAIILSHENCLLIIISFKLPFYFPICWKLRLVFMCATITSVF